MVSESRRRDRERETVWSQLRKGEAAWIGELSTLMKRPSLFERAVGRPTGNENGGAFVAVAPSVFNHVGAAASGINKKEVQMHPRSLLPSHSHHSYPLPRCETHYSLPNLECQSHRRLDEILMKWRGAGNEIERESPANERPFAATAVLEPRVRPVFCHATLVTYCGASCNYNSLT